MGKAKDSLRKRKVKVDNNESLNQKIVGKNATLGSSEEEISYKSQLNTKAWFPSIKLIFGLLLVVRSLGATFANINDCDEVFNFWEPTHFLQYGHGLQTWEYSPVYAIRAWAYILIHYFPLKVFELFFANKATQFYSLRYLLSAFSAFCETWMIKEIANYTSTEVGIFTLMFLLGSPGMFHAAPAFLPSTFAMYTTTLFFSGAIRPASDMKRRYKCLLALGVGCLLGWPFSAAVGIPFVLEEFHFYLTRASTACSKVTDFLKNLTTLVLLVLKIFICVTLPIVAIDYYFYKKITLVPFNIVLYNVLGASDNAGPNIFGTEPWTFYFKNGFLNYSICFLLALSSLPLLLLDCVGFRGRPSSLGAQGAGSLLFKLAPFYWWFGLFLLQPHKEERFLFVIYPLFAFNSAISLSLLKGRLSLHVTTGLASEKVAWVFVMSVALLFSAFSVGRIYGQYDYFHGTLELYNTLSSRGSELLKVNTNETATVCVGGEWFRFPSHYFLPQNSTLSFVKANFDGLLPKPFPSGPWRESISSIPSNTNNQNREEMDRYVQIQKCNFLITTMPTPDISIQLSEWESVHCTRSLETSSIPTWRRAFYVPPIGPFKHKVPDYFNLCLLKKLAYESDIPGSAAWHE